MTLTNESLDSGTESREQDYLLGCDAEELIRLAFQHRVWARQTFTLWEEAEFAFGSRVLDIGSGPGFATLDLAHWLGSRGRVLALDSSSSFLAYLQRQAEVQGIADRIETRQGDLHEAKIAPNSLDGAFGRWVFCFLRDPEQVLRQIIAALRPGSRLAILDYFNYRAFSLGPRSPALDRVVDAVQQAWTQTDGDLEIQGRMPALLERLGMRVRSIQAVTQAARPGSPLWNWPRTFFDGFLPKLVAMELITPDEAVAFDEEWAQRADQPGAFLSLPPMYSVIAEKRL